MQAFTSTHMRDAVLTLLVASVVVLLVAVPSARWVIDARGLH